ncbi:MAG: alanine racemase [Bdellovibrionota bacterium]
MKPLRPTYAEIHLDCLEHNLAIIRENFPEDTFLCPMIKANAYGHSDVMIGSALEKWGVKHLGVCLVEEAILLREVGIQSEILIFRGFGESELEYLDRFQLTPVVTDGKQLELLIKRKRNVSVHLKFNTGMNRLGFEVEESAAIAQKIIENPFINVEGILTHLADGESSLEEGSQTEQQLQKMSQVIPHFDNWNPVVHALNSGGLICKIVANRGAVPSPVNFWGRRRNWGLRPGICLYGYNPTAHVLEEEFLPVMSLKSHIQSFRRVKKGGKVSYNGTWTAPRDSVIGVVPIGYADGLPRITSNQISFLIGDQMVPQVGRVCMDFLMVDATSYVEHNPGYENTNPEVTLFGWSDKDNVLSVEEMAKQSQTITYEILSGISERVPRVYKPLTRVPA